MDGWKSDFRQRVRNSGLHHQKIFPAFSSQQNLISSAELLYFQRQVVAWRGVGLPLCEFPSALFCRKILGT